MVSEKTSVRFEWANRIMAERGFFFDPPIEREGREGTSPGWRTHPTSFLERGFTMLVVAGHSG
jgi:hypothetical protein